MAQGSRLRAWFGSSLVAAVMLAPLALAQVAFEVASVKESKSLEDGGSLRYFPDGGVRAGNVALRGLITIAHELQPYQLEGVPAWANAIRYDIEARPSPGAKQNEGSAMLQALLVERFAFKFHRETREIDGFALVRTNRDRLGPQFRVSPFDCEKAFMTTPACREGRIGTDQIKLVSNRLAMLLQIVVSKVGAPVSDETALTGLYDIDLHWSNEVAPTDDRPSIYQALQDQLGLKLERRRVMTEVVVVDRLERATPD